MCGLQGGGAEQACEVKSQNLLYLEEKCEPLSRHLQGFLALSPSSRELVKGKLAKSSQELDLLEREVAGEI